MSSNMSVIARLVSTLIATSVDPSLIRAMVSGDVESAFQRAENSYTPSSLTNSAIHFEAEETAK